MRTNSRLILGLAAISLVLGCASPSIAQDAENARIQVFVFCSETAPDDAVVDLKLPPGEWKLEPMFWGPEGNTYSYDIRQAHQQVEQLNRQLQRTKSQRNLIELVETGEEALVVLEIIATQVSGVIQGESIFGGATSVTTPVLQDVLVTRLTVSNSTFTTDFLGTKTDGLRTPAFTAAAQIEKFVKDNFDALRSGG